MIYQLDLIGTAVFASAGVLSAGGKRMDLFGVVVVAMVSALGGGTLRDVILDANPVFWVSDPLYLYEQGEIYARRLLDPQQLALYRDIYAAFYSRPCAPRLVLFLQDSAEHCLERITRRNRSYERGIRAAFLQDLADDYEALFASWTRCPVIRIRADLWSGLSDADVDRLAGQVAFYIKAPSKC